MTRSSLNLLAIAAIVLAGIGYAVLGQARAASPQDRQATAAVATWLQAAARGDTTAMCAAEAPPASYAGSVRTERGVLRGAWAQVCPQTYDTAKLRRDAPDYQRALKTQPTSTVPWADGQVRVNYAAQGLALYAVQQPEGWRVVSTGHLGLPSATAG